MKLKLQKRLVHDLMNVGKKRIKFPQENAKEIKEAITKSDIKKLINSGVIEIKQKGGKSKAHARYIRIQKRKGRRQGKGSREGKRTARLPRKQLWMARIRIQRRFIKLLREKQLITTKDYRSLYLKAKSGAFRSKRHIKIYITEQGLIKNGKK
ncbi:MAG TPA: 50S ribosomal protein L19e [Candidatus Nanoarchaeia archaeon]|nr:50S ribosomal protein L19e [Candidatus Nanoarchaeia archaeon]